MHGKLCRSPYVEKLLLVAAPDRLGRFTSIDAGHPERTPFSAHVGPIDGNVEKTLG